MKAIQLGILAVGAAMLAKYIFGGTQFDYDISIGLMILAAALHIVLRVGKPDQAEECEATNG